MVLTACLLYSCTPTVHRQDKEVEKAIERLVSQMTLEEKIGQMNQISSFNTPGNSWVEDAVKDGRIGSILNEVDPVRVNNLQKIALDSSRLGIPLLIGRDVIHGFKTIFPIPLGLAATFNPRLVEEGARVAAIEATSAGVRWTFSPMLDISRDPRWGRIAEGFGEDTYLTSVMGVAMVKGYQGQDLSHPSAMAACAKHFVGYGAAEGGRDYNSTYLPERLLRNVYLPPFHAAVRAGAMTVMTSFNDNDGIPSTGNRWLTHNILREEWGFSGFVVSDWASVHEMITHGFAAHPAEAARLAVQAGVDMDMMSFAYVSEMEQLVKEGKVSEKTVNKAVKNILRVKFRLGLFENPYVNEELHKETFYAPEHLALAKESALESVVLLSNDGTLPLDAEKINTLLVTGPMADDGYEQLGTWVFDGEENASVTPLAAIQEKLGESSGRKRVRIVYEPGLKYSRDNDNAGIQRAAAAARSADAIIVFVGEESILSGEAHCLADLNLQGGQSRLIQAVKESGKPVITVIVAGRPLTIKKEADLSNALLYSFHPGTMGGPALADLLFGDEVPSGKLPVTFPVTTGQIPIYYNHNSTGRPYQGNETSLENIPVRAGQTSLGNTGFYLDAGAQPLFPFGYGLSYTTFAYTNIRIDKVSYRQHDTITLNFDLTNTGKSAGTEVAQLYVRHKTGSVTRPIKELIFFERIPLESGQTRTITWNMPIQNLAFWNLEMKETVETGQVELWIAGDSASGESVRFEIN
ncbi:MAG: beta-glucosidase BglX [Bacteroidales bacterium]|nr:beta-glucosidase BglX [Bacteroidales bacterium]